MRVLFDARWETPLESQGLVNGPVMNAYGITNALVVVPGDLNRSLLYRRLTGENELRMPPLAHNCVDRAAAAMVAEWIRRLGATPK